MGSLFFAAARVRVCVGGGGCYLSPYEDTLDTFFSYVCVGSCCFENGP